MVLSKQISILAVGLATLLFCAQSIAMPVFARKYEMSCNACHSAYPRLNEFGERFAGNNMKLENWRKNTDSMGDDQLALPKSAPLAVRMQGFAQARKGENIDPQSGARVQADTDVQSPYLIKLLSSAPLSENISYYFYGIMAEKGGNGEIKLEDAWFRHGDVFGTGIGLQLGQFQISDLMFPRETRLTFQDYMVYRMAGITYDRGVLFDRSAGPFDIGVGLMNGNGITANATVNSPGYQGSDHLFDDNNGKTAFGRIGLDTGPVALGLFGLSGEQKSVVPGTAGTQRTNQDVDKRAAGVDLSGTITSNTHWFIQYLYNEWVDFLGPLDREWSGGFVGVDYIPNDRWAFSTLYNYADANDLDDTDTIYEGIDTNSLTFTTTYYFMRNLKGIVEVNADFLNEEDQTGSFYTGHLDKGHYFVIGLDAAF